MPADDVGAWRLRSNCARAVAIWCFRRAPTLSGGLGRLPAQVETAHAFSIVEHLVADFWSDVAVARTETAERGSPSCATPGSASVRLFP